MRSCAVVVKIPSQSCFGLCPLPHFDIALLPLSGAFCSHPFLSFQPITGTISRV